MRFNIFIVSIVAVAHFANCGHHSGEGGLERTSPEVVGESDRAKSCPHGFTYHGKDCTQVLKTEPSVHCPPGFIRSVDKDDVCAKYYDKIFECPVEFVREKGMCQRTRQAEPLVQCPPGFAIVSDGRQCVHNVPLPPKVFCPPGTAQRHNICLRRVAVPPQFVCSPGFTAVEDGRCQIVEEYDCSPITYSNGKESYDGYKHHKKLRLLGEKKKHSHSTGKDVMPTEDEFVSSKTCTRVRTEGATKICPKGSQHHGKDCLVDEEVPMIEKPGGFKEEFVGAQFVCPDGHRQTSNVGYFKCLITEEVPLHGVCPITSEPVGNSCAKFRPLIFSCPAGYLMEAGVCFKTIVAPPLVEYNVSFQCVGKDCDQYTASHKHHKK